MYFWVDAADKLNLSLGSEVNSLRLLREMGQTFHASHILHYVSSNSKSPLRPVVLLTCRKPSSLTSWSKNSQPGACPNCGCVAQYPQTVVKVHPRPRARVRAADGELKYWNRALGCRFVRWLGHGRASCDSQGQRRCFCASLWRYIRASGVFLGRVQIIGHRLR
jgi:hypothetical protein